MAARDLLRFWLHLAALTAALWLRPAIAHLQGVATATSASVPNRITFMFVTYEHNSNHDATPGTVTITTPLGSYTFGFNSVAASTSFPPDSPCSIWKIRALEAAQGILAAGRPVVPADSTILCYGQNPNPPVIDEADRGAVGVGDNVPIEADRPSAYNKWWYFVVLDNVVSGFYKLDSQGTDEKLDPASGGVTGPSTIGAATFSFDVGVADGRAACASGPAFESISGLMPISDSRLCEGVPSGFACPVVCQWGLAQVGQLVCEDGIWSPSFRCGDSTNVCGSLRSQSWPGFTTSAGAPDRVLYDSNVGCGPSSLPGANCSFTCTGAQSVGFGKLRCSEQGGRWIADPGVACLQVGNDPPPAPRITQVGRDTDSSIQVFWEEGTSSTATFPVFMYLFSVSVQGGASSTLACADWNDPAPPIGGIQCFCTNPAQCDLDEITVTVTARNQAGDSLPSEAVDALPPCPTNGQRQMLERQCNCAFTRGYTSAVLPWNSAAWTWGECPLVPCPAGSYQHPLCACVPGFRGQPNWDTASVTYTDPCVEVPCPSGAARGVVLSSNTGSTMAGNTTLPPGSPWDLCSCTEEHAGESAWDSVSQDYIGECLPKCRPPSESQWSGWKEDDGLPDTAHPGGAHDGSCGEWTLPGAVCAFTCTPGNTLYGNVPLGKLKCDDRNGTWEALPGAACQPVLPPPAVRVTKVAWASSNDSLIVMWALDAASGPTLPINSFGFRVTQSASSTLVCEDWIGSTPPAGGITCRCTDPSRCDLLSVGITAFTLSQAGESGAVQLPQPVLPCPVNTARSGGRECICPVVGFIGQVHWSPEQLEYVGACVGVPCPPHAGSPPTCACLPGFSGSPSWNAETRLYEGNCQQDPCSAGYSRQVQWSASHQGYIGVCAEVSCPDNAAGHPNCTCLPGYTGGASWDAASLLYVGSCQKDPCDTGYAPQVRLIPEYSALAAVCVEVPCPPDAVGHPSCTCLPGFQGSPSWDPVARDYGGSCRPLQCSPGYTSQVPRNDSTSLVECAEVPCPANAVGHPTCTCLPGFAGNPIWDTALVRYSDTCEHVLCPAGSVQREGEPCRCDEDQDGEIVWNAGQGRYEGSCDGSEGVTWAGFIICAILEVSLLSAGWVLVTRRRWSQRVSLVSAVLLQLPATCLVTYFLSELWQAHWAELVLVVWTLLVAKVVLLLVGWPMWRSTALHAQEMSLQLEMLHRYQERFDRERTEARANGDDEPDLAAVLRAQDVNLDHLKSLGHLGKVSSQVSNLQELMQNFFEEWKSVPKPCLSLLTANREVLVHIEVVFMCPDTELVFKYQVHKLPEWVRYLSIIGLAKKYLVKCVTIEWDELNDHFSRVQSALSSSWDDIQNLLGWGTRRAGTRPTPPSLKLGGEEGLRHVKHMYNMETGKFIDFNSVMGEHVLPTDQEREARIRELRAQSGEVYLRNRHRVEYELPDGPDSTTLRFDPVEKRKHQKKYTFFDVFEWHRERGLYVAKQHFRTDDTEVHMGDTPPPERHPEEQLVDIDGRSARPTAPYKKGTWPHQVMQHIESKERQTADQRQRLVAAQESTAAAEERFHHQEVLMGIKEADARSWRRRNEEAGVALTDRDVEDIRGAEAQAARELAAQVQRGEDREREALASRLQFARDYDVEGQKQMQAADDVRRAEDEVKRLTEECATEEKASAEARARLKEARGREENLYERQQELQHELEQVKADQQICEQDLEREADSSEQRQEQLQRLTKRDAELRQDVVIHQGLHEHEADLLQQKLRDLDRAERSVAKAHGDVHGRRETMEQRTKDHKRSEEQLESNQQEKERQVQNKDGQLAEAKRLQSDAARALEKLKEKLQSERDEAARLERELATAQEGSVRARSRCDAAVAEAASLRKERTPLQEKVSRLHQDVRVGHEAENKVNHELHQAGQDLADHSHKLAEVSGTRHRLDGQRLQAQFELDKARSKATQLQKEIRARRAEAAVAQATSRTII